MDDMQTIKVKQDTELGYKIIYLSDFDSNFDVEYIEPGLEPKVKDTITSGTYKAAKVSKSKSL